MMFSLLKSIFFMLLASLLIVLLLLYIAPKVVPQDNLKQALTELFERNTGKNIIIAGPVDITLFPHLSLSLTEATILDPKKGRESAINLSYFHIQMDSLSYFSGYFDVVLGMQANGELFNLRLQLPDFTRGAITKAPAKLEVSQPIDFVLEGLLAPTPNDLRFDNINLRLNGMEATGTIHLFQQEDLHPKLDITLHSKILDVDKIKHIAGISAVFLYNTAPTTNTIVTSSLNTQDSNTQQDNATPLDFSWMDQADVDIRLESDTIIWKNTPYPGGKVSITNDNQLLTATLEETAFYGGTGNGTLTIDTSGEQPSIHKQFHLTDIHMGAFLRDFYHWDRIDGKGSLTIDVTGSGTTNHAVISNLNGQGSITLKEGMLNRINLLSLDKLSPQNILNAFHSEQGTKVVDASANFTIQNGEVTNDDLVIHTPISDITGNGVINLSTLQIKYRLTPNIGVNQVGLKVPLTIKGDLRNPKITPAVSGIVTQGLDTLAKDNVQVKQLKEEVEDIIKFVPDTLLKTVPERLKPKQAAPQQPEQNTHDRNDR